MESLSFYNTIFVNNSNLETVKEGRFYTAMRMGNEAYIFDAKGKRTSLNTEKLKWKEADDVVMFVKITSSLLDTVKLEKIYRVFNDAQNDERYLIDEEGEKVLFDTLIFNYEMI